MFESKSEFEILEQSRKAAIKTAANVLEGIAKAKKLRRRLEASFDDDRRHADKSDKSDFLFDMLRLNATYLNEMARMGQRYGGIAQRALENLYSLAHPRGGTPGADELLLTEKRPSRRFVVQNDVNPDTAEMSIEWPCIRAGDSDVWKDPFTLTVPRDKGVKGPTLEEYQSGPVQHVRATITKVPFGEPIVLEFSIDFSELPVIRRFETELVVSLELTDGRKRRRRIPVLVDPTPRHEPNP